MSRRLTQRRRRARKRKKRQRDKQAIAVAKRRGRKLTIHPGLLDIARGYDGLLRGHPEPVLLIAAYDARPGRTRLLWRSATRYERVRELPTAVRPRDMRIKGVHIGSRIPVVLVAIAVEEDSSRDIQELCAELDDADGVVLWPSQAADGIPGGLDQLPEVIAAGVVAPVELKVAGRFPSDWFAADDYVAAAALWIETSGRRAVSFEIPARSADGRNEWLARIDLRVR